MDVDLRPPLPRPPPRRPLIGLALAFIAGLAAVPLAGGIPTGFWLIGSAMLLAAALVFRRHSSAPVFLLAATALAGAAHARLSALDAGGCALIRELRRPREQAELVVRIADDPVRLPMGRAGQTVWQFEAEAEGRRDAGDTWRRVRAPLRVRLPLPEGRTGPAYGERWRLGGVVRRDPVGWQRRLSFEANGTRIGRLSAGGGNPVVRACYERRRASRAILRRGLDRHPGEAALIEALVLGYREDVPEDVRLDFLRTGTLHVMAISGMHVGVVLMLLRAVLRAAGLPRTTWALAVIPLLALYALSTGAAASAVRAWAMAVAYWSALLFRRRPDLPTALAVAALAILVVEPAHVRDPGFIYSFGAVAGLSVFYPRFMAPFDRLLAPDAWAPDGERRLRWRRAILRYLAGLAAASAAAWIVSAPLSARFGNLVSPVALPGNIPVIPASFLVLLTGCLSLLGGLVSPWLAEVFNHANACFATAMIEVIRFLVRVPGGHWYVATPPGWMVWGAFGVLGGMLLLRGRARATLAAATAAVALAGAARWAIDDAATIELAGDGLAPAAFVNLPGEEDLLIDPGPAHRADAVVRWLHRRGVDRLQAVAVTQIDADHGGGMGDILRRIPAREIWRPSGPVRSHVLRDAFRAAESDGVSVLPMPAGTRRWLAGDAEWEVFHPAAGEGTGDRASDTALTVRIGRGPGAVFLGSSLSSAAVCRIAAAPVDAAATVLVADRGLAAADLPLLRTVRPRLIALRTLEGLPDAECAPACLAGARPDVPLVIVQGRDEGAWTLAYRKNAPARAAVSASPSSDP